MEARKTPALYQKRDGKWYCTLRGRQRYLGKDLEVAREKLKGLLEGKEEKRVDTVGEIMEAYLASLKNNQSPDTIRTKEVTYRSFRKFVGERTRMSGITAETIERYKQHGFAEGLKRQTVRSRLLNLSALFEHAVKLGIIKTNPVRQVPRVKVLSLSSPRFTHCAVRQGLKGASHALGRPSSLVGAKVRGICNRSVRTVHYPTVQATTLERWRAQLFHGRFIPSALKARLLQARGQFRRNGHDFPYPAHVDEVRPPPALPRSPLHNDLQPFAATEARPAPGKASVLEPEWVDSRLAIWQSPSSAIDSG